MRPGRRPVSFRAGISETEKPGRVRLHDERDRAHFRSRERFSGSEIEGGHHIEATPRRVLPSGADWCPAIAQDARHAGRLGEDTARQARAAADAELLIEGVDVLF